MKQKYIPIVGMLGILLLAGAGCQQQTNSDMLTTYSVKDIVTEEVNYFGNSRGFLARPMDEGRYPGVVMIHEWWGLNDNIREMARELASQGYVVLAVDLYNGESATTQERARQLSSSIDRNEAVGNMKAAAEYLRTNYNVGKMASLGWCFGGGQSLALALSGEEFDATVIYYGNLVRDETELSKIRWPVLGVFGEKDTSIPVENVREFQEKLNNLGVMNEIYVYEGVGHAFANPSGMNYAPEQAKDAWEKTVSFLNKNLKNQ